MEKAMHELPITERIIAIVLDHAESSGATRVVGINLKIGEMSDLLDEWLQRYFDYLSKGTVAEGAIIRVERLPVRFRCNPCDKTFRVDIRQMKDIVCPVCGSDTVVLVSGREFFIKEIEVV